MALNQTAYTVNPGSAETKTIGANYTTISTSTIYTTPSSRAVKVKSFCVSIYNVSGGAATDRINFLLKIGTGEFSFTLESNTSTGVVATSQYSSDTLGFDGGFLQATDTITGTTTGVTGGGMTFSVSVCLCLEDYMA